MFARQGSGGTITVVIPTHNRAQLLDLTLKSVMEQDRPAREVIVADDGSTDDTSAVLRRWGVRSVRNPHGGWGPARARNEALAEVTTPYVKFLDSDDLLLPNALRDLGHALDGAPDAPFAFARGLSAVREPGGWRQDGMIGATRSEQADLLRSVFVRNSVPSPGALARTETARAVGGYDAEVVWSEDHHFWVRLAQSGPPVHLEELTCIYRRHPGNRYTPSIDRSNTDTILALADADSRLGDVVAERLGVELCEVSLSAVKAAEPGVFVAGTRRLLALSPDRRRTLTRAARHFRERRLWWRAGERAWAARADIRAWLAPF